jgi:predicted nucleic acid-binding protein
MSPSISPALYVDSSVLLHAILGTEDRALAWYREATTSSRVFSSTLLRLDVTRVLHRDGQELVIAEPFLRRISLISVTDRTLIRAGAITCHIKTLDSIHLATILDADPTLTLVTHDAAMARAAKTLGITSVDPL